MSCLTGRFSVIAVSLAMAVAVLLPGGTAEATFPGSNGKVAFIGTQLGLGIDTLHPDGSGLRRS